jgi:hypothetical protein
MRVISRRSTCRVLGSSLILLVATAQDSCDWEEPVEVKFVNDMNRSVEIGLCDARDKDACASAEREYTKGLNPGESIKLIANAVPDITNGYAVTTTTGELLGCFFLRYNGLPERPPIKRISDAGSCITPDKHAE